MEIAKSHKWTDEEIKLLMKMWDEDKAISEIAIALKCSSKAIERFVRRLRVDGVPLKKRRAGNLAGRRSKPWTQSEVEYFVKRRDQGATSEEIAAEIGRTYHGVETLGARIRQAGVPVKLLGAGCKKLWSPDVLRAQILIEEAANATP